MADEDRRPKRSRFDQTEPEPRRPSRFDRRSRSPSSRQSETTRTRSPLSREARSPSAGTPKNSASDPAAAAGMIRIPLARQRKCEFGKADCGGTYYSGRCGQDQCPIASEEGNSACRRSSHPIGEHHSALRLDHLPIRILTVLFPT